MYAMLGDGALAHDENAMDVQETSTFRFSEEPTLEKMWAKANTILTYWTRGKKFFLRMCDLPEKN